tara:strand:+ start:306 stop:515 length:210 start_codon:yes stop_codon:yes gene_type:complete
LLKSETNKLSKLFVDKKPPEEIIVNDKLKASNVLRLISLYNKNIIKVSKEYNIIILNDCFKISEELKEI